MYVLVCVCARARVDPRCRFVDRRNRSQLRDHHQCHEGVRERESVCVFVCVFLRGVDILTEKNTCVLLCVAGCCRVLLCIALC